MAQRTRFTIYDVMEQKGYFDSNPANAQSRDNEGRSLYRGPVEYPRMFYHPLGLTRVTVPAEIIVTPMGPKAVGEQREIVWQIANTPEEGQKLAALGWHKHPADAIAAAGGEAPERSATDMLQNQAGQLSERDARIAELEAQLEALTRPPGEAEPFVVRKRGN